MHNNKLVTAIKVNGKVLREDKDTVFLPFGQEYAILIKNLNSVRAQVKISVDGQDATENVWLVVQPNAELELERFIKNGNNKSGNRFKFIEFTKSIEQHRGVGVEDGLIRVEFQFEKLVAKPDPLKQFREWEEWNKRYMPPNKYYGPFDSQPVWCSTTTTSTTEYGASVGNTLRSGGPEVKSYVSTQGITVPGSISDQRFEAMSSFPVESESHVMVLRLMGESSAGTIVTEAVTVKHKPQCVTCGRINKATSKFCSNCGTSLQLV